MNVAGSDTFSITSGASAGQGSNFGVSGGYLSTFYASRRVSDSVSTRISTLMIKPVTGKYLDFNNGPG